MFLSCCVLSWSRHAFHCLSFLPRVWLCRRQILASINSISVPHGQRISFRQVIKICSHIDPAVRHATREYEPGFHAHATDCEGLQRRPSPVVVMPEALQDLVLIHRKTPMAKPLFVACRDFLQNAMSVTTTSTDWTRS